MMNAIGLKLGLTISIFFLAAGGASEERGENSNGSKLFGEMAEILDESEVRISISVYRPDLDHRKEEIARGLHEGYLVVGDAKKLLRDNLLKYPFVVKPIEDANGIPDFADFTGFFIIEPKGRDFFFRLDLDTYDFVTVWKKRNSDSGAIDSETGVWFDCERTVYLVCETLRNMLKKGM